MILESEQIDLKQRIAEAVSSGDILLFNKLKRAKSELSDKQYFLELQAKKQMLAELKEEAIYAKDVRHDLQNDLRASGRKVEAIRRELENQEAEHAIITSRLYALDSLVDSNRQSIFRVERELEAHINSKIKETELL